MADSKERPASAEHTLAATSVGAQPTDAARQGEPRDLARGTVVGRYIVLATLGAGGMGAVYAAYDPELDRKVALKLLLAEAGHGHGASEGRTRLLREAQALARLSHPNVVSIHDVGTMGEQVYLAMEHVEGVTLGAWLESHPRRWDEVLDTMQAAGHGLEAAHRAGLLHRDFKPDNVMVGTDGRVRVMDFGLARTHEDDDEQVGRLSVESARLAVSDRALSTRVTQAGALLGTPAYMAPEQFGGGEVTAAADQFSFCVTLWQALFGERPFAGNTVVELATNVLEGKLRPPPRGSPSVPAWLRQVCVRGLSVDPEARFPSMAAFLDALGRGRGRASTRRWVVAACVVAVVGAGAAGYQRLDVARQTTACEAEGAEFSASWNAETRGAVRDGLLATGLGFAEMTADGVMPWFDEQAEAWQVARTQSCLDARVQDAWDEDLLERSRWCLDDRRMQFEALAAELSQADETVVRRALIAAASLSRIEPCRDRARLVHAPEPPDDPTALAGARRKLSRVDALLAAGRYELGIEVADETLEDAEAIGWKPLVAEARRRRGVLLDRSGRYPEAEATIEEAYFEALRVDAMDVAADAAVDLIFTVGNHQERPEEGLRWARLAEVALEGLGVDENSLRYARYLNSVGATWQSARGHAEALDHHSRALAIEEAALGPDHPSVATSLTNLANAHHGLGDHAEAMRMYTRVLALQERALGPEHPSVADALNNLAVAHYRTGDYGEAIALLERSVTIREKAFGPDDSDIADMLNNLAALLHAAGRDPEAKPLYQRSIAILEKAVGPEHPKVATSLNNLANLHNSMREFDEARSNYEGALSIWEKARGPDHPDVASALMGLANVHEATGERDEAKAAHARALAIREETLGPEHPDVADSLANLAQLHEHAGAPAEARPMYERAIAIREKALGSDHPRLDSPLAGLARIALARGDPAAAIPLAERAVQVLEGSGASTLRLASRRFLLARALWNAPEQKGRDRARARSLAERSRDAYRQAEGEEKRLAEVDEWLAAH